MNHTQGEICHELKQLNFDQHNRDNGDLRIMNDDNVKVHVYKKVIILWTKIGPQALTLHFKTLLDKINEHSGPYSKKP